MQLEYAFAAQSLCGPLVLESVMVFYRLPSFCFIQGIHKHTPKGPDTPLLVTHLPVNSIVTFE